MEDVLSALGAVVNALNQLDISYFVTGSLASGARGEFRATNDVDIVAALSDAQVEPFGALVADRLV
jgi:hypothetical protein